MVLMAFPNLIALFVLAGVIAKETRFFEHLLKKEKQERALKKKQRRLNNQ